MKKIYDFVKCPKCEKVFLVKPPKGLCRWCKAPVKEFEPKETLKLVKYDATQGMIGRFDPFKFTEGTPLAVYTIVAPGASTPTLPLADCYRVVAEDKMHDWNFDASSKYMRYYSRFPNSDTWILIQYI